MTSSIQMKDISKETYGKYMSGFSHWGLDYSDDDEGFNGAPIWGAIPAPWHKDRRPWRGVMIELLRRAFGAHRGE